jgi:hypothetical protein
MPVPAPLDGALSGWRGSSISCFGPRRISGASRGVPHPLYLSGRAERRREGVRLRSAVALHVEAGARPTARLPGSASIATSSPPSRHRRGSQVEEDADWGDGVGEGGVLEAGVGIGSASGPGRSRRKGRRRRPCFQGFLDRFGPASGLASFPNRSSPTGAPQGMSVSG